jgi:hypothetical protein
MCLIGASRRIFSYCCGLWAPSPNGLEVTEALGRRVPVAVHEARPGAGARRLVKILLQNHLDQSRYSFAAIHLTLRVDLAGFLFPPPINKGGESLNCDPRKD